LKQDTLYISKKNEAYMTVVAESSIRSELADHFSFMVPGVQFMAAYKNKMWDGKIRLYNTMTGDLYLGLISYVEKFAADREYMIEYEDKIHVKTNFSIEEAKQFISTLKLKFEVRDYQIDSFVHAVREGRGVVVSPTASGKSLIIYLLIRYYELRSLIIVPTTSLVYQMQTDFIDYGMHEDDIHIIMGGKEKKTTRPVIVSTWQSLYKLNRTFFEDYEVVIGDEVHLFKAKSLTSILVKMDSTARRFGFTGTLDGSQVHRLVLEGLFGPVKQFVTTKDLIKSKHLSPFRIKSLVLDYTDDEKKQVAKMDYQTEITFLIGHPRRNKFIKNLVMSLNGNTLLLFERVDTHGRILFDLIEKEIKDERKVFFVYGGTSGETREQIRKIAELESSAIIVASYGTFSTGINIRNLHNIIFSSPTKSVIRVLQSIGRVLRLGDKKDQATLFDLSDDLRRKSKNNFSLKHFAERIKIYAKEGFDYKIYNIKL